MTYFSAQTFELLGQLSENNNKEWFADHKKEYEEHVKHPFAQLLEDLSGRLSELQMTYLGGEKTMFRVNRDVRFSNDKSPYSTHVSGVLSPSGTKSESTSLIYLHLEVGASFAVAGLYRPSTERLGELRTSMIEKPTDFKRVLGELKSVDLVLDTTDSTKMMPRDFKEYSDHEFSSEIKLKNLMTRIEITEPEWMSDQLIDKLADFGLNAKPLLDFIEAN